MNWQDATNGLFELVGAAAIWLNVRQLLKDKVIKGVDWRVWYFYSAWGLWNLYYYPHLDQWLSFYGGIAIVSGNLVWLALAIFFRR